MKPVGIAIAEINLDSTPMERALKKTNEALTEGTIKVENAYKSLGLKSDQVFNMMKANAVAAVEFIKNKTLSSLEEIYNAEKAASTKIAAINAQQFAMQRDQYSQRVAQAKSATDAMIADRQLLGVRTTEIINAEKAAIESAYLRQKAAAAGNARDLIVLEEAKNAKMLALNMEIHSARLAAMNQEKMATASKVEAQIAMEKAHSAALIENDVRTRSQGLMQIAAAKETSRLQQEEANKNYATLGMRSAAAINEQKANIIQAAADEQAIKGKSSDDWVRIERAKNEKLKELNKEMTGQHEMSMASMTRAVLRFYAAYYVISTVFSAVNSALMSGIKAIDDMKMSVTAVAAQITTMQGTTGNVTENYKKNVEYAKALIPVLMKIDANSYANLSQIQKMNTAMSLQGFILDVNNEKQIRVFTALSNAVKMYTGDQDPNKQAMQEVRALFTGQTRLGDMVALQMDQQIKRVGVYKEGLKGLLEEARKLNVNPLELMEPYLKGIVEASKDIQGSWSAVSSSMETTWNIIQRKMFAGIYADMVKWGKEFNDYLRDSDSGLNKLIDRLAETGRAIKSLYNLLPEGTGTAATYGVIGAVLFGTGWGATIAALSIVITKMKEIGWVQELMAKKAKDEAAFADVAAGVMAKRSGLFGGGASHSGVTKDFGVTVPDVGKAAPSKETLDAAKKAADEEIKRLKEIADERAKAIEEHLKAVAKEYDDIQAIFVKGDVNEYKRLDDVEKEKERMIQEHLKAVTKEQDGISEAIKKGNETREKYEAGAIQRAADEARKMVTFYNDLNNMEEEYRNAKLNWIEKEAALKKSKGAEEIAVAKWVAAEKVKLAREEMDAIATKFDYDNKYTKDTIANTGKMLDAAMTIYDKDSYEYNRLAEWKKGVQIAELAMEAAKNATIISGLLSRSVATVAAAVVQNAANTSTAVTGAVSSVAAQGSIPYAGFAMAAAMLAFMASVLGMAGIAFGGGGGGSASMGAAYGQNTPVLGGANNQGSESIGNTWKLLEDTYDLQKHTLTGIYDNMKQLNANITGIVKGIVQGNMGMMTMGGLGNTSAVHIPSNSLLSLGGSDLLNLINDKIFGSSETTQTASGLMVGGGSVKPYAQTHTEDSGSFFGLFGGGSSDSRAIGAIDTTLTNLFYGDHGIYTTLKSSVSLMATTLGGDVAAAQNKVFDAFELNFIGKTPEEISKIVSEKISAISDTFVSEVFGNIIRTYQTVGEGAFETASRLTIDLLSVTDILSMTGKTYTATLSLVDIAMNSMVHITGDSLITVASKTVDLSESLIALAGGLDKLQTAADTYYDKFTSDADKQADLQKMLIANLGTIPALREGYKDLVKAQDLSTESGREYYVMLLNLAGSADTYYSALEDVASAQDKVTESLLNQHKSITQWLSDLNRSTLAPSNSMQAVQTEYNRLKGLANRAGASESDTSSYLNYAKEYLDYMRKYGGDYKAIYAGVTADAEALRNNLDSQIGVENQQLQALLAIERNTAATAGATTITATTSLPSGYTNTSPGVITLPDSSTYTIEDSTLAWYKNQIDTSSDPARVQSYRDVLARFGIKYADGGYADSPSIFGDGGGEWAVPTYEPQRKNFLKSAPQAFWDNLGLNGGSNGPGGEVTVHAHFHIDGKEIGDVVTKQIPRNGSLKEEIRRAAN